MAINQKQYHAAIIQLQYEEGLHNPEILRGMLPEANIQLNADIIVEQAYRQNMLKILSIKPRQTQKE